MKALYKRWLNVGVSSVVVVVKSKRVCTVLSEWLYECKKQPASHRKSFLKIWSLIDFVVSQGLGNKQTNTLTHWLTSYIVLKKGWQFLFYSSSNKIKILIYHKMIEWKLFIDASLKHDKITWYTIDWYDFLCIDESYGSSIEMMRDKLKAPLYSLLPLKLFMPGLKIC